MGEISISLLKPNNKIAGFVAAVVLLILGIIVIAPSGIALAKARRSLHWTSVKGVIIGAASHVPGEGPDYLTVLYKYNYDDTVYQGNRICFGMDSIGEKQLGSVRAGQAITVFVNPQKAQECVLVPGLDGGTKVFVGIGGGLIALGLIVYCSALRGRVIT